MICEDTNAAEFIPIRLMISVVVIAAISFLIFTGLQSIQSSSEADAFENEIHMIRSEISLLYATGEQRDLDDPFAPTGTKRVFHIHIPSSVTHLSFGSFISASNGAQDADASSGIFYTRIDGTQKVIWCEDQVVFRKGILLDSRWTTDGSSPVFSFSSLCEINVTFELVSQAGQRFVLIY